MGGHPVVREVDPWGYINDHAALMMSTMTTPLRC